MKHPVKTEAAAIFSKGLLAYYSTYCVHKAFCIAFVTSFGKSPIQYSYLCLCTFPLGYISREGQEIKDYKGEIVPPEHKSPFGFSLYFCLSEDLLLLCVLDPPFFASPTKSTDTYASKLQELDTPAKNTINSSNIGLEHME